MCRVLPLLIFLLSGCAFNTGIKREFSSANKHRDMNLNLGRVWIRSFDHVKIGSVVTAQAVGSGGSATGYAVSREQSSQVPTFLLHIVENSGIFKSVTPEMIGDQPDFILEGTIAASWETPWWTWIQAIDLWLHAWLAPTIGSELHAIAEIRIYNDNREFLSSWSVRYTKKFVSDVWWALSNETLDVTIQQEVMQYMFDSIADDLTKNLESYLLKRSKSSTSVK
jgi:hypothetical protein